MSLKTRTGIYSLGINQHSFLGLIMPIIFFLLVGGAAAIWMLR